MHKLRPLEIVATQAEQTVIVFVPGFQQRASAAFHDPLADRKHPHRGQGHAQEQHLQAIAIIDVGVFQVEAHAFPIAEGWFDPETLATATRGLSIGWQVQGEIAGMLCVERPVGDQVDGSESMLFGQSHRLQVTPLSGSQGQFTQSPPALVAAVERQVGLQTDLPVPVPAATQTLDFYRTEFTVGKPVHLHWFADTGRQPRFHPPEQVLLLLGRSAAKWQQPPDQRQHKMVVGHPQTENAPPVFDVCAIHDQTQFATVPIR